jgi:hypothetical protein
MQNNQPQEFMFDPDGPEAWKNYHPQYQQKESQASLGSMLENMRGQFAAAAQKVYNEWEQDDEGMDIELGSGGICQDIASAFCDILSSANIECTTFDAQVGDQHVWAVAYDGEEAFSVDIPPSFYETGGGYNWQKIPDVVFDESFIYIEPVSMDNVRESEGFY